MNKTLKLILVLLATLLIGVGVTLGVYYGWYILEVKDVPYSFTVVEGSVGLLLANETLAFGNAAPGSWAAKHVVLVTAEDMRVVMKPIGDGAEYIWTESPEYLFTAHEEQAITVKMTISEDAVLGEYNGTARFFFYRR